MKTIGMIGGMSWESTLTYYKQINEAVKCSLGGLHSAKIVLNSVDFHEIEQLQKSGDWEEAGRLIALSASQTEAAGAGLIIICTNTMHKVVPQVKEAIEIPLLHIADATAEDVAAEKIDTIGLLGTRFTMEDDFYRGRLASKHGLDVLVPEEDDREFVHRVIFEELCLGKVLPESKERFLEIIERMSEAGAEGVILGCTEIGLLVSEEDTPCRLFDTALIHAEKAARWAVEESGTNRVNSLSPLS